MINRSEIIKAQENIIPLARAYGLSLNIVGGYKSQWIDMEIRQRNGQKTLGTVYSYADALDWLDRIISQFNPDGY